MCLGLILRVPKNKSYSYEREEPSIRNGACHGKTPSHDLSSEFEFGATHRCFEEGWWSSLCAGPRRKSVKNTKLVSSNAIAWQMFSMLACTHSRCMPASWPFRRSIIFPWWQCDEARVLVASGARFHRFGRGTHALTITLRGLRFALHTLRADKDPCASGERCAIRPDSRRSLGLGKSKSRTLRDTRSLGIALLMSRGRTCCMRTRRAAPGGERQHHRFPRGLRQGCRIVAAGPWWGRGLGGVSLGGTQHIPSAI